MWLLVWLLVLVVAASTPGLARKEAVRQVQGVVGETVFLPCDTSMQLQKDAVLLILWYRQDLGTPIYSVDARQAPLAMSEQWADEAVFSSRAYFVADQQPEMLGIDRLQEKDAALYRCRVDFRRAQTRNSWANLTVIVPPARMVVVDADGAQKTSVVGPYSEGDSLLLYCDVTGGKPRPEVTWYWGGSRADDQSLVAAGGGADTVRAQLRLQQLQRTHLGGQLRCEARNHNHSSPLHLSLTLDMNLAPLDVRIVGGGLPLSAGRRYDLLCVSTGSRPPAVLTWWRSGQRLDGSKDAVSDDGNATTSMLSLRPTRQDGGKHLSCKAENSALPSQYKTDGWVLDVHYAPEIQLQLGKSLSSGNIREGMDVYFDCLIRANPPVHKVEWKHDDGPLHHDVGRGVIISNQSLVLQAVGRNSSGRYSCVGHNDQGTGNSAPFFLNVLYAPACRPGQPRVLGVSRREQVNVTCEVDANPKEVVFRWQFNNTAGVAELAGAQQRGTTSTLEYAPQHEGSYGMLQCTAANRAGSQRVPCLFHVVPASRPDPVRDCVLANRSATSLLVTCEQGSSGGLPQLFLLRAADEHGTLVAELTSRDPRFSLDQLLPGRPYQLTITSVNPKGAAPSVGLPAATLPRPSDESSKPGQQVWQGAITVVAVVLVALVVCASTVCLRRCLLRRRTAVCRKNHVRKMAELAADENNPDVVPQPRSEEGEGDVESSQKQVISTIETSLEAVQGSYVGYCALEDALQLQLLTCPASQDTQRHARHSPSPRPLQARVQHARQARLFENAFFGQQMPSE